MEVYAILEQKEEEELVVEVRILHAVHLEQEQDLFLDEQVVFVKKKKKVEVVEVVNHLKKEEAL